MRRTLYGIGVLFALCISANIKTAHADDLHPNSGASQHNLQVDEALEPLRIALAQPGLRSNPELDQILVKAIESARKGDSVSALRELNQYLKAPGSLTSNQDTGAPLAPLTKQERHELLLEALKANPKSVIQAFKKSILGLKQAVLSVHSLEISHRDTMAFLLSPYRNRDLETATTILDNSLYELSQAIGTGSPLLIEGFMRQNIAFASQMTLATDALFSRFSSALTRAQVIQQAVASFKRTGKFSWNLNAVNSAFDSERGEQRLRIYVNQRTVGTTLFCASLIIDVMTLPYGGAGAIPPTLKAIQSVVGVIGKDISLTSTALDMGDRALGVGSAPFWSLTTGVDIALTMLQIPAPTREAARASSLLEAVRLGRSTLQYGYYAVQATRRLKDLCNADDVAKKRRANGEDVTAASVRREAISSLVTYAYSAIRGYPNSAFKDSSAPKN